MNISEDLVIDLDVGEVSNEFDRHYGIIPQEELVIIRCYSDDSDDVMLSELKPRYIVLYEPSHEFIRRIEVCLFFVQVFKTEIIN
jgi:DNA excision repair protein ERCC-4